MLQSTVIAEVFSSTVDHFALDLVTVGEVQVAKVERRVGGSPSGG